MPIFSKRELEGYVLIDHSHAGGGITPQQAWKAGHDTAFVPAGHKFESPTRTCRHCTRVVILNPDRSRGRGYCRKCDAFLCDDCASNYHLTGVCKPFTQVIDEVIQDAVRQELKKQII